MIHLEDSNIWTQISANLAQKYRVIPLRIDDGITVFVAGDPLTQEQLTKTQRLLTIRLGRRVILETMEGHPELGQSGFNDLIDQYYGVLPPPTLTLPIASDMMIVILITALPDRREQAAMLRSKGYRVLEYDNPDDAAADLEQHPCRPGRIVASREILESHSYALEFLAQMLGAELTDKLPVDAPVLADL